MVQQEIFGLPRQPQQQVSLKKAAFLLLLFVFSCKDAGRVPLKKALLEKELQSIDWKQVDEYPSVPDCDSLAGKQERRNCFFEFLTATIQEKLNADTLPVHQPKLDTVNVEVTVFPNAKVTFKALDSIDVNNLKIDSILKIRLADFPLVNPALKRGLPVKTQFVLPVVVEVR